LALNHAAQPVRRPRTSCRIERNRDEAHLIAGLQSLELGSPAADLGMALAPADEAGGNEKNGVVVLGIDL
jgi:hypothetical protein